MRYTCASLLLLACFLQLVVTSSGAARQARSMVATVYDDGKSCPGGCDAHVVFHRIHNGTRNAFDPASDRSAPRRCTVGQPCKICFSEDASSCMLATYRGGGPPVGRFDFTPAFFEENCPKPDLPSALALKCRSAQDAMPSLENRVNCVANPTHERCRALMDAAAKRKAADDELYAECQRLGEAAFNRRYRNQPRMQRSLNCSYERFGTGRNSRGITWRRLLDGACRPGTYAGRDGLDCCTGSLYEAALLGRECAHFFVRR